MPRSPPPKKKWGSAKWVWVVREVVPRHKSVKTQSTGNYCSLPEKPKDKHLMRKEGDPLEPGLHRDTLRWGDRGTETPRSTFSKGREGTTLEEGRTVFFLA